MEAMFNNVKELLGQDVEEYPNETQREVDDLVEEVEELPEDEVSGELAQELEQVEEAEAARAGSDKRLSAEVRKARAELCTQQGFEAHEMTNCEAFMKISCPPVAATPQVPAELCETFFGNTVRRAAQGALRGAPAPGPAPGGPMQHRPNATPTAAPKLFGGKTYDLLPEQGFHGKLVRHMDFETMAEDWMQEREGDPREICKRFPNNEWCLLHFPQAVPEASSLEGEEAVVSAEPESPMPAETEPSAAPAAAPVPPGGEPGPAGSYDARPSTPPAPAPQPRPGPERLPTVHEGGVQWLRDLFRPFESSSSRTHVLGAWAALLLGQLLP